VVPPEPKPNAALTDIAQVFHPWLVWASRHLREGVVPLWNPHAYAGVPFFGNGQSALLFPLTLLPVVIPPAIAVTIVSWLKLFGIGVATYWWLRTLAVAPLPALIGAWTFMLSATVIGWLQWTLASTLMFLPALLAATERLRLRPGWRTTAVLALIVAFDVFAGYPQGTLHALVVTTVWALCRLPGGRLPFAARYALGVALGLGVAAIQILPFVEYVRQSLVFAYRGQWTLPLWAPARSAVTFVMPYFYGTGAQAWGPWQFNILVGWVGIVPIVTLPVAVVAAWRRPGGRFVLGLGAIALALHFGMPVLFALSTLPGLSLGTNLRLMPLIALALAALVAFAAEWLGERVETGPRLRRAVAVWFVVVITATLGVVAGARTEPAAAAMSISLTTQYVLALIGLTLGAALVARALAGAAPPQRIVPALAALQLASLLPLAMTYNPSVARASFYPTTPALDYVRRETADGGRVLMPGHLGLLYGLREAHGYDGLTPRRIEEVTGPVGVGRTAQAGLLANTLALHGSEPLSAARLLASPVLDLVGVRYLVLPPGTPPPRPDLTVTYDAADARVFRNDTALPQAFVVGRGRCVTDREARLLIAARAVDFRREVLLADCDEAPPASEPGPGAAARITAYGLHAVSVRAVTDRPAFAVLTDTWYPGWVAYVDGQPARLWRADHAFRAVRLEAGEHVVEFRYEPTWLEPGLVISLASVTVVAGMLVVGRS
jgi:hypothetical protein